MPVHTHSTGNLKKLNQKTKSQTGTKVLPLKQQKQIPKLNKLFKEMVRPNEVAYFCCPNASPFSLQKTHFFLVTPMVYPLGKTPHTLGMAWSYARADGQARTGVTTDGLAHC